MYLSVLCLSIIIFSFIPKSLQNISPKLEEFNPKRSQKVETKFSLHCSPQEGSKPFQFEWRKNGLVLKDTDPGFKIDSNGDESLFTIFKLDPKDSANYSCMVRNKFGQDSQSTALIVKGLPNLIFLEFCFSNDMWRMVCGLMNFLHSKFLTK